MLLSLNGSLLLFCVDLVFTFANFQSVNSYFRVIQYLCRKLFASTVAVNISLKNTNYCLLLDLYAGNNKNHNIFFYSDLAKKMREKLFFYTFTIVKILRTHGVGELDCYCSYP